MKYTNKVKAIGANVDDFKGTGLLVLFGDNAPDTLKDFCYTIDVLPVDGTIEAGMTLSFDDNDYKITAIGDEAQRTLEGLGHCTICFNGATEVELPGTIYVEAKPMPEVQIGTVIKIS
ncbi:MAG: PTS glucitol/sorbitol transporter subunit IIA [Coriobacteriia bacterium]|nr:PTS glucitol/sorbitol transporter subunit IIA [Coriobacteriia bacterium]